MHRMKKFMAMFLAVAMVTQSGFTSSATEAKDVPQAVSEEATDQVSDADKTVAEDTEPATEAPAASEEAVQ